MRSAFDPVGLEEYYLEHINNKNEENYQKRYIGRKITTMLVVQVSVQGNCIINQLKKQSQAMLLLLLVNSE